MRPSASTTIAITVANGTAARIIRVGPTRSLRTPSQAAAIAQDGAEVIILGGGAVAGLSRQLVERINAPLLDGVTCAVRMAEALHGIGASKARVGSYRAPATKELVGVSPVLAGMFSDKQ